VAESLLLGEGGQRVLQGGWVRVSKPSHCQALTGLYLAHEMRLSENELTKTETAVEQNVSRGYEQLSRGTSCLANPQNRNSTGGRSASLFDHFQHQSQSGYSKGSVGQPGDLRSPEQLPA
jgi:hypothetical protein